MGYFKKKIAKPRRKESLDSMYNVKKYVESKFPKENDDRDSECISEFNDADLGFTNKHLNTDQLTRLMMFHYFTP